MKHLAGIPIYLIDDDKIFITSLLHQLKGMFGEDINIRTFHTGEEFLKQLSKKPCIILLDYYLNSTYKDAMNGLEILKRINFINPEAKVIILSSQDKMEIAVDTIKHGACDYIVKNENVFLRVKLSVINTADALRMTKELRSFRSVIKTVVVLITLIVTGCVLLQRYYPEIAGVG
jgi:DNA-binding NtrC family response regulator